MTNFILIGGGLALGTLLLSLMWVWFSHKEGRNEVTMWRMLVDAFNMPTKALTQGSQYLFLVLTLAISTSVGMSMHERMLDAGDAWKDIPLSLNLAIQYLGTIAVYLIPMLAGLILDDRNRREGWIKPVIDPNRPNKNSFRNTGIGFAVFTALVVTGLSVGNYFDVVSTAMMTSMNFFVICMSTALAFTMYGYTYRGASNIEVLSFILAVIFGAGVYALDFHWNQQLTIEIPLSLLDLDKMTDAQITTAVNDANQAFTNRTLITLVLILLDLFSASLALLSGEILWFVRLQQGIANARITDDAKKNVNVNRTNVNTTTTNNNTNTNTGGGGGTVNPTTGGQTI